LNRQRVIISASLEVLLPTAHPASGDAYFKK
jgi:hypothetical protein